MRQNGTCSAKTSTALDHFKAGNLWRNLTWLQNNSLDIGRQLTFWQIPAANSLAWHQDNGFVSSLLVSEWHKPISLAPAWKTYIWLETSMHDSVGKRHVVAVTAAITLHVTTVQHMRKSSAKGRKQMPHATRQWLLGCLLKSAANKLKVLPASETIHNDPCTWAIVTVLESIVQCLVVDVLLEVSHKDLVMTRCVFAAPPVKSPIYLHLHHVLSFKNSWKTTAWQTSQECISWLISQGAFSSAS